jgi:hypothetical protein
MLGHGEPGTHLIHALSSGSNPTLFLSRRLPLWPWYHAAIVAMSG